MKKIVLFITLSFIAFSCDKDKVEENTYSGSSFVSFENITSTSLSIPEDGGAYDIKILLSEESSSDVTVSLGIEAVPLGGVVYTYSSSQVTIPAGQLSAIFTVTPVNDDTNTPSSVFKLTIENVSPGIIIGLKEVGSYEKTVTIVNDDCPTKFNFWFGSISCEDVGYGTSPGTGSSNANGDCDILKIDNDLPGAGGTAITNNFEFSFVPDFPGATTGSVVSLPTYMGDRNFTIGGVSTPCQMLYYNLNGTYDEVTKTIVIDYAMRVKAISTGTIYNWYPGQNIIIKP